MNRIYCLALLLLFVNCSNKPNEKKVREFDMTEFCDDYYVLTALDNTDDIGYVFIGRNSFRQRFFIWKNYNMRNSGYGYLYSYTLDVSDALKNGVHNSAKEAVSEAEENLPDNMIILLNNIQPWGDGKWLSSGEILINVCR